MKVTLHSTDKIVTLVVGGQDVPARIWEGETERGVPCHAYITRIACRKDHDASQFEAELCETRQLTPTTADVSAIPLRMIL